MSLNYNKVILAGRLTAPPELRVTPSGISVATFNLAVNRNYADKTGERQTDFFRCTAWRGTADFISKYFTKASAILIEGSLQLRSWEDEKTGAKRYATDIITNKAYFVESRKDDLQSPENIADDGMGYQSKYAQDNPTAGFTDITDDSEDYDLPF